MSLLTLILFVAIGGIFISAGVHFMPVGGAPAAMATSTGVGTGTAMLAAGSGLTGLITAASMMGQPVYIMAIAGAVGAMLMMGITMLVANLIYVYGIGVVLSSSKVTKDPITGRDQEIYKTPGTEGHGIPTSCFVSGIIGALLGGVGGSLIFYAINECAVNSTFLGAFTPIVATGLAAIIAVAVFFINAVIASYNIGGTIEGFQDPKFKRIGTGIVSCAIVSIVIGIFIILMIGGI